MSKGFANVSSINESGASSNRRKLGNERMISWSPWPPANFQSRYPAFPLVMTILLLFIVQIYISVVS